MKKKPTIIIAMVLCTVISFGIAIRSAWSIPNQKWLNVCPGMTVAEIESLVGRPNHPSRDLKEMDRWIVDTALFNSRLIVYYRNPEQPSVASGVEVTRYCKLTGSYPVKIEKE